jgi:hypothetical protein
MLPITLTAQRYFCLARMVSSLYETWTRMTLCPKPSVIQKPITIQSKQKIKATGKGADTTQ